MPKKKNSYNAFYFFMKDWQKQEEMVGSVFPNGIRDVQTNHKCNEAWKNLSDKDKAYYKNIERNHKMKMKTEKKTSYGESVDAIGKKEMEQKLFIDNMKENIKSTVKEAKRSNCLEKLKFYVIHANYAYSRLVNGELEYYPAEIAIAEFSLEEGITRIYHRLINSKVHIGYASAVIEHSNTTHQISRDIGEPDHAVVYKEICDFLETGRTNGKLPFLYTCYEVPDIKNPVICILNTFNKTYGHFNNEFTVYSFEELFLNVHNIGKPDDSEIIEFNSILVSIKLKEDPFDYKKSLQCEFHNILSGGGNYCSKSYVQRWIFMLYTYCYEFFGINLIPGRHMPEDGYTDNKTQLINSFRCMNIGETKATLSIVACKNAIKNRSERTHEDERRRRLDMTPLELIYHSDSTQPTNNSNPDERPLRQPFTKSLTSLCDPLGGLNFNQDNFPSIGRGARRKEWGAGNNSKKPGSYVSCLKQNMEK